MRCILLSGVLFFGALLMFTGCDSADTLDDETVPGTYESVTFMADVDGEMIDVKAAGATIEMTLAADGTVTGGFFVPAALGEEGEGDRTFDLAGTYTVEGDAVTFAQEADTFIRDETWTFDDGALSLDTDELDVVLRKQ